VYAGRIRTRWKKGRKEWARGRPQWLRRRRKYALGHEHPVMRPCMTAACGVPAFPWHPEWSALLDRRPPIPMSPPSTTVGGTDPPHEEAPVIELRGLRKVFGGTVAVEEIDLTVPAGEIHGIVGRSGAGKSTLIRCLTGLESPTAGTVSIDGVDLTNRSGAG